MNHSIEVNGNQLAQTCSEIRASGHRIESIDAMVHGLPAQWRVNYFVRETELETQPHET